MDPELLRPRTLAKTEPPVPEPAVAPAAGPLQPDSLPPRLASPAMGDDLFLPHFPDAADDAGEGTAQPRRRRRVVRRRELHDKAVDPGRALRAQLNARPKREMPPWLRWLLGWRH